MADYGDIHRLNTTIVEGPIERHKSPLGSRETGEGVTGAYYGRSVDPNESLPKLSREWRARAGLRKAPGRTKS